MFSAAERRRHQPWATAALVTFLLEGKLREKSTEYLHVLEVLLYIVVGALLAAAGGVFQAGALMLVELLHTVRISVRSQALIMEPFLSVGLIASFDVSWSSLCRPPR